MRNPENDCTNAFDQQFLSHLDEQEPPSSTTAAMMSGPWTVRPHGSEWGCFREGDSEPEGVFEERSLALLLAAALPASADPGRFQHRRTGDRFAVIEHGIEVGRLRYNDEDVLEVLSVLAALVRSPLSLAHLLAAAGAPALEKSGLMLLEQLSSERLSSTTSQGE